MKVQLRFLMIGVLCCVAMHPCVAMGDPVGSAFTYQGQLKQNGQPFNGNATMEFRLFDAATAGAQVGSTITIPTQSVANGLFTSPLDFGVGAFTTDQVRWLEIRVNGTTLAPRQILTAAPLSLSTRGINVDALGRVGIGGLSPLASLDVGGTVQVRPIQSGTGLRVGESLVGSTALSIKLTELTSGQVSVQAVQSEGTTWGQLLLNRSGGFVGIGTDSPEAVLDVNGTMRVTPTQAGTGLRIGNSLDGSTALSIKLSDLGGGDVSMQSVRREGSEWGNLNLNRSGGRVGIGTDDPLATLDVRGTTRTQVVQITGADLAEKFPASEELKAGMVVAIDPTQSGKLCLARGAYNKRVAGIVSGAKDFVAGAVLGNLPGNEDAPPIALSGRVYVWADASVGPIERGDMLTTSATVGHAMKAVDRERSFGSVIGKAMEPLKEGRGLILVLVNLQ